MFFKCLSACLPKAAIFTCYNGIFYQYSLVRVNVILILYIYIKFHQIQKEMIYRQGYESTV